MTVPSGSNLQVFFREQFITIFVIFITTIGFLIVFLTTLFFLERSGRINENPSSEVTKALSGVEVQATPEQLAIIKIMDNSIVLPTQTECKSVFPQVKNISAINGLTIQATILGTCGSSTQYSVKITKLDTKSKSIPVFDLGTVRDIALLPDKNRLIYTEERTNENSITFKRFILSFVTNQTVEIPLISQCMGDIVAINSQFLVVLTGGNKIQNTDNRYKISICLFSISGKYISVIEASLPWFGIYPKLHQTANIFLINESNKIGIYSSFITQNRESLCGLLVYDADSQTQDLHKVGNSFSSEVFICPQVRFDTSDFVIHQSDIRYHHEDIHNFKEIFTVPEILIAPKIN